MTALDEHQNLLKYQHQRRNQLTSWAKPIRTSILFKKNNSIFHINAEISRKFSNELRGPPVTKTPVTKKY